MRADHWKIRWFQLEHEFGELESDKQRELVWLRAQIAANRGWRRHLLDFCLTAAAALVLMYPAWLIVSFLEWHAGYSIVVRTILLYWLPGTLAGTAVSLFLYRNRFQRCVREEIRTLQIPLCPHCGYNLTGLIENRCPECGSTAT